MFVIFLILFYFFFQAEDGIRDGHVTGVQTCALPISIERRSEPIRTLSFAISKSYIATESLSWRAARRAPSLTRFSRSARSEERRVGKEESTQGATERSERQRARRGERTLNSQRE